MADCLYFRDTISPDLISLEAAALTRVGVKRLSLPMKSCSPHTQAVSTPFGPYEARGTSFLRGNLVAFGSKGMVMAVWFMVRKSFTWSSRAWAVDLLLVMGLFGICGSRREMESGQSSRLVRQNGSRNEVGEAFRSSMAAKTAFSTSSPHFYAEDGISCWWPGVLRRCDRAGDVR